MGKGRRLITTILLISSLAVIYVLSLKYYSKDIFNYFQIPDQERIELLKLSKSQLQQDIFVYLELNKKRNGFFVEFGASDGINLSNSYMLEKYFGWSGILAEPGKIWHERLKNNRTKSIIESLCVWNVSGSKILFNETPSPVLSTIDEFSDSDSHSDSRTSGTRYEVETISLVDLLKKYNAPEHIDYLSIDTEGSEYEILEAFFKDNTFYKIKIITCEHNYTNNRKKIYKLLTDNGYIRKYKDLSKWDDFYVYSRDEN